MRIRRLDLLRYGHFTDTALQLPAGKPDFHFVAGPNEAGKSTALSAIEDLLFGIPHNSTRNFTHDYNTMYRRVSGGRRPKTRLPPPQGQPRHHH